MIQQLIRKFEILFINLQQQKLLQNLRLKQLVARILSLCNDMTIELEYNLVLSSWTFSALSVIIIAGIITTAVKRYQYVRRINRVPGAPGGITILGNAIHVK